MKLYENIDRVKYSIGKRYFGRDAQGNEYRIYKAQLPSKPKWRAVPADPIAGLPVIEARTLASISAKLKSYER